MELTVEEQKIIINALLKAKDYGETKDFETEKQILDSYKTVTNENAALTIQMMYDQLLQKIKSVGEEK
jgi:uncharacterized SAM-binding protein YcdF (DUF218 family)